MIAMLEWLLGSLTIVALVVTMASTRESVADWRAVLLSGQNGRLRALVKAHLARDIVRLMASLFSLVGAVHLLLLPNCVEPASMVAKAEWSVFLILMLCNAVSDHRERTHRSEILR